MSTKSNRANLYTQLLLGVFKTHYRKGLTSFEFDRAELLQVARELDVEVPKNIGDVLYSFRYRNAMPKEIVSTADKECEWIIEGVGRARYVMKQIRINRIEPRSDLLAVKIPEATPDIIKMYALDDEQALLARVRYNRLIDIFLSIVAYSLQNHLRTTVKTIGQIEIDEIYIGVDRSGSQFIVPVQAKSKGDRHSVVQTMQDITFCREKFPLLNCRAVSAQFVTESVIAMFELTEVDGEIRVVHERHFNLVPAEQIGPEDLKQYRLHSQQ